MKGSLSSQINQLIKKQLLNQSQRWSSWSQQQTFQSKIIILKPPLSPSITVLRLLLCSFRRKNKEINHKGRRIRMITSMSIRLALEVLAVFGRSKIRLTNKLKPWRKFQRQSKLFLMQSHYQEKHHFSHQLKSSSRWNEQSLHNQQKIGISRSIVPLPHHGISKRRWPSLPSLLQIIFFRIIN